MLRDKEAMQRVLYTNWDKGKMKVGGKKKSWGEDKVECEIKIQKGDLSIRRQAKLMGKDI